MAGWEKVPATSSSMSGQTPSCGFYANGQREWNLKLERTAVSHHINYGNLVLVWEPGTFSEAYHMGRSVGFFSAYTESMQN